MTTAKRRIPINDHDPVAGETPVAPADTAEAVTMPEPTQTPTAAAAALDNVARERDTLADSLLRLRAEFDNFRRRAARELVESRERAQGELLSDLLPVLDNLERALDAAEHHDEGKVLGGVRMTRDMFVDLLSRAGVEEIETVGVQFDPQVHDAMLMQPSDHDEGAVTAVLERGYRQGHRVLRPARVVVSAGPAEPGSTDAAG
jgi:molecular chaperone GrpE